MSVDLKVPAMGESVTEIYIGKWYKSEGDAVEQDEQLVELESEKATLDLRAPAAGVLSKILKSSGDSAGVGEVIGQIDDGSGSASAKPGAEAKSQQTVEHAPPSQRTEKIEPAKPRQQDTAAKANKADDNGRTSKSESKPAARESGSAKAAPTAPAREPDAFEEFESPAKRRARREAEQQQAEEPEEAKQPPAESSKAAAKSEPQPPAPTSAPKIAESRAEERVAMSPIRRRIALRLVEAQKSAALLTTFNEVDMSAVKAIRSEYGESFERRHGVRLGFMAFFVRAAIEALRDCQAINAMIDGDDIVYRRFYDIGVAISTDKGLVVPILRNADQMSFAQIEKTIEELAKRAREGKLTVDELQGGTFTITNGGVFGSLLSTPIVNPPQSGVLGMHTIQERPVVVEVAPPSRGGAEQGAARLAAPTKEIVIRPMMYVALTYDHRIVDGKEAVTFLRRIKETIEDPARLLLEV